MPAIHRLARFLGIGGQSPADTVLVRRLVALLTGIAGLAVAAMIVVTCVDVIGRRLGRPLPGAYDLVEILGAGAITGALPDTTAQKGHVAIEFLLQKLGPRGRAVLNTLAEVIALFLFTFLTWRFVRYGLDLRASGQVTLTLGWPIFWLPGWMALCTAVLVLLYVNRRMALILAAAVALGLLWAVLAPAGAGGLAAVVSGRLSGLTPVEIGGLGCAALLVLLCCGVPVAIAMAVVGFAGFAAVVNGHAAASVMTFDLYKTFASYSLTVIPLFVLMGQVAFHGGISRRLFGAAYHWLGPLPGGLAMATVGACTAFGAICGSGPATTATMTAVALPEMRRYRYSMELACGAVASGGSIGMMIPPSVVFIVYAIMTEQSIGKLFLAGILPGIATALLFCGVICFQCLRRPEFGPRAPSSTWKAKILSLRGAWETLVLFVAVMGGMFYGFFTPTEGAAIGAAGTILITVAKRSLGLRMLVQSFQETLRTSCMVMIIVAGAVVFGHFLAVTRIPYAMATWLGGLALPGWAIMVLIVLFYLVAGCFVDALALILLTIPIFYPVVTNLQYDPIWFGVMIVLVTQMGVITPPVGVCVYVVSGMEREVPLETIFRGALPFLAAMAAIAVLLILFPDLALVLPRWIHP